MKVTGIDERNVQAERTGGSFVVFIYEGGDDPGTSWSVDSHLLTEADLPRVFGWLGSNLPVGCCWSLGMVEQPEYPTAASDVSISWIVGSDVLNLTIASRQPEHDQQIEEMLTRRHHLHLS